MRESRPELLVIEGASAEAARSLLERARAAAEAPLPAVLVLPGGATWLRGVLPLELQPCVAVSSIAAVEVLSGALAGLTEGMALTPTAQTVYAAQNAQAEHRPRSLRWVADRREVRGPGGTARLTRSEGQIFAALLEAGGRAVGPDAINRELWGEVILDRHAGAAIRSHIYTLRRKLAAAGLGGALISLPGIGYRLEAGAPDAA